MPVKGQTKSNNHDDDWRTLRRGEERENSQILRFEFSQFEVRWISIEVKFAHILPQDRIRVYFFRTKRFWEKNHFESFSVPSVCPLHSSCQEDFFSSSKSVNRLLLCLINLQQALQPFFEPSLSNRLRFSKLNWSSNLSCKPEKMVRPNPAGLLWIKGLKQVFHLKNPTPIIVIVKATRLYRGLGVPSNYKGGVRWNKFFLVC